MNHAEYKKYIETYAFVAKFYNHMLLYTEQGAKALDYLLSRGFTKETIKKYNIGWASKGDILSSLLDAHKYDLEKMGDYGLLRHHEKTSTYKDFFNSRIVFPIRNEIGETLGFSGRVLPGNNHPAKYLNTQDTAFFEKGNIIYNLDLTYKRIKERNVAFVFEGYLDAITATQYGLTNVVSAMGVHLTEVQIEKLHHLTNRVVICFDGDDAGLKSAKQNGKLLSEKGLDVRIAIMPPGIDPHDYIKGNGVKVFAKEIISKAQTYVSFCKEYAKRDKDLSLEIDKLEYANEVLSRLTDNVSIDERESIFNEMASELNVCTDSMMEELKRVSMN